MEIRANVWEHVDGILDLVDLARVKLLALLSASIVVTHWVELFLGEHRSVVLPDHEDVLVERSQMPLWVEMGTGPLIEVKVEDEDVGVQERLHFNTFLEEDGEVLVEQVTVDEVVLVLNDILDDDGDSSNLVVAESAVNGRPVEVL